MEKNPKRIHFVSWKKHKVDQATKQVDNVCQEFFDDLLFETIIDVFRQDCGFPGALPVREIIRNEPIIPSAPFELHFETPVINRSQKCPVCNETLDATRFTSHLSSRCFKECNDKMEILQKYLESNP